MNANNKLACTHQVEVFDRKVCESVDMFYLIVSETEGGQAMTVLKTSDLCDLVVWGGSVRVG